MGMLKSHILCQEILPVCSTGFCLLSAFSLHLGYTELCFPAWCAPDVSSLTTL